MYDFDLIRVSKKHSIMETTSGILSDEQIAALFAQNIITTLVPRDADQIQPASLDLRLGYRGWRVRASFLPGHNTKVKDKLARLALHEFDLREGAVLETGCVYIVELREGLRLPAYLTAAANPKSSTGRLDVFTRLIIDGGQEFDKIPSAYHGPLYLEISPRTFPIIVRSGSRLAQIRFRQNAPAQSLWSLDESALQQLHKIERLTSDAQANISGGGVALSVDLEGNERHLIGYRGKRHAGLIDVDQRQAYHVLDFWEPIYKHGDGELVLDPNEFYILMSREAVHVPPAYAAEMTPFDPLVGEFRVHYAGFFDPGFGNPAAGGHGSRAVLEVRSRDVPFILEHGQIVGRLLYEPMASLPVHLYGTDLGSNYQAQGLKLSKHFK